MEQLYIFMFIWGPTLVGLLVGAVIAFAIGLPFVEGVNIWIKRLGCAAVPCLVILAASLLIVPAPRAKTELAQMASLPTGLVEAEGFLSCESHQCGSSALMETNEGARFFLRLGGSRLFHDGDPVVVSKLKTPLANFTAPALCLNDQCVRVSVDPCPNDHSVCRVSTAHACMERAELRRLLRNGSGPTS